MYLSSQIMEKILLYSQWHFIDILIAIVSWKQPLSSSSVDLNLMYLKIRGIQKSQYI